MNQASKFLTNTANTLIGLTKIIMQSRRCRLHKADISEDDRLIILANGPSLRQELESHIDQLAKSTTMVVNFAANTPEFKVLRPKYYILADPHFFTAFDDVNVVKLLDNLRAVDWPMDLIVNVKYRNKFEKTANLPACISIKSFNAVGVEGFKSFEKFAYDTGAAMPRPRNVLIAALMVSICMGYKTIYVCGADHSWMHDINVDDDNCVMTGMKHFYEDSDKEADRVRREYQSYKLHDIIYSLYIAFKSYHQIERYARSKGVAIYNSTPGSYIDAFKRRPLPF